MSSTIELQSIPFLLSQPESVSVDWDQEEPSQVQKIIRAVWNMLSSSCLQNIHVKMFIRQPVIMREFRGRAHPEACPHEDRSGELGPNFTAAFPTGLLESLTFSNLFFHPSDRFIPGKLCLLLQLWREVSYVDAEKMQRDILDPPNWLEKRRKYSGNVKKGESKKSFNRSARRGGLSRDS